MGKERGEEKRKKGRQRESKETISLTFHLSQAKPGDDNTLEGGNQLIPCCLDRKHREHGRPIPKSLWKNNNMGSCRGLGVTPATQERSERKREPTSCVN